MSLIIFSHRTGHILNLSSFSVHVVHKADWNTNCFSQPYSDKGGESDNLNAATPAAIIPSACSTSSVSGHHIHWTDPASSQDFHLLEHMLALKSNIHTLLSHSLVALSMSLHTWPNRMKGTEVRRWIPIQIRHVLTVPLSLSVFAWGNAAQNLNHKQTECVFGSQRIILPPSHCNLAYMRRGTLNLAGVV